MKTILDIDAIAGFFRKLARLPKVWWTQLVNSIKRKNCPQVKIVHRKGLDWTIYTRPNGHTKEWEFREIVLNLQIPPQVHKDKVPILPTLPRQEHNKEGAQANQQSNQVRI